LDSAAVASFDFPSSPVSQLVSAMMPLAVPRRPWRAYPSLRYYSTAGESGFTKPSNNAAAARGRWDMRLYPSVEWMSRMMKPRLLWHGVGIGAWNLARYAERVDNRAPERTAFTSP
jgi:hypothetical protein